MPHYFISKKEPQSLFEMLLSLSYRPSKATNSVSVRKWLIVFCNNPRDSPRQIRPQKIPRNCRSKIKINDFGNYSICPSQNNRISRAVQYPIHRYMFIRRDGDIYSILLERKPHCSFLAIKLISY